MTIDPTTTLARFITENPILAPTLDRLGIDYCCGGQRRLGDAVVEAGYDTATMLAVLGTIVDTPRVAEAVDVAGWTDLGISDLVDHIETTHHRYLHESLRTLDALAVKVASVHGAGHPELVAVASNVHGLVEDLEPHLRREEQVLFPMIRQLDVATTEPSFGCGSLANPITVMRFEHDRAGELLAELRDLTGGYTVPGDGCASYAALYADLAALEADIHLHVHKENNVLFPAVLAAEQALTNS